MSDVIDAVIFDVDGTLVDSVDLHARAWQEALAHFGYVETFERVRSQIGKGGDQLIPVFVPKADLESVQGPLDEYRGKLFRSTYLSKVTPWPGVRDLFGTLRAAGKRIALASSAKGPELEHYKQLADIADLVDTETSADDAEKSKPHPDIFQVTRARLGDPPQPRCVVVADSPYDAEAATRAGLRSVAVLCGGFDESWLRAAGYALIHKDPQHLLQAYRRDGDAAFGRVCQAPSTTRSGA